jgi:hypothetical protein
MLSAGYFLFLHHRPLFLKTQVCKKHSRVNHYLNSGGIVGRERREKRTGRNLREFPAGWGK